MNDNWKIKAEELANRQYSNLEYRKKITRIMNMSMLCHRSTEIDQGALLYFSVNDMFLGKGDLFIMLFSEISPMQPAEEAGRDVYGQLFTYAIIEEVVSECFSGHYTFYSSELDGRLVVLVCFLYGILPDELDIHLLYPSCENVSKICAEQYGMNVITYISKVSGDISSVASLYNKLLNLATLHRYLEKHFDSPVVSVAPAPMAESLVSAQFPYRDVAKQLANAVINMEDYKTIADEALAQIADFRASSAEDLKVRAGDFFDILYSELLLRGVKLNADRLREEHFRALVEAKYWRELSLWLHKTLDDIAKHRRSMQQETLRQKLIFAREYIDGNILNPNLSISEIGEAIGVNASFLSIAFRQHLHVAPAAYIRKKRLEQAMFLLKSGKAKISEISERCGFGSVETFHRAFKAEFGMSPAKLRRAIPEDTPRPLI